MSMFRKVEPLPLETRYEVSGDEWIAIRGFLYEMKAAADVEDVDTVRAGLAAIRHVLRNGARMAAHAPDSNCVTAGDGSCIASGPCMHSAAPPRGPDSGRRSDDQRTSRRA